VFDGDPAPTPKGAEPHSIFGPRILWPNGCMDQDATWYGGRPRPRRHCVRCGPSYPQNKGHTHPTQFLARLLWPPNGLMDEDAVWYGSRARPRTHCTRRGPSSRERGTAAPPLFSAHFYCSHGHPSELLLSSCNLSHLDLVPPLWATPFEFCQHLLNQKTTEFLGCIYVLLQTEYMVYWSVGRSVGLSQS